MCSLWFGGSVRPVGWALPPVWDAIAADYATADGWIRLHTNAPHHRAAALAVLGFAANATPDKVAVSRAVAPWSAAELETAVVNHHGCAAAMLTAAEWAAHTQAQHVNAEPLVALFQSPAQDVVPMGQAHWPEAHV